MIILEKKELVKQRIVMEKQNSQKKNSCTLAAL